jgi:hypothetical protein
MNILIIYTLHNSKMLKILMMLMIVLKEFRRNKNFHKNSIDIKF